MSIITICRGSRTPEAFTQSIVGFGVVAQEPERRQRLNVAAFHSDFPLAGPVPGTTVGPGIHISRSLGRLRQRTESISFTVSAACVDSTQTGLYMSYLHR